MQLQGKLARERAALGGRAARRRPLAATADRPALVRRHRLLPTMQASATAHTMRSVTATLLCLLLAAALAGPAAAARRRAPPRRPTNQVCLYCGMTRTKFNGMQPMKIMLGASRDVTCSWGGEETTLSSVASARADLLYRFGGGTCSAGACPKVLTVWGEKFFLNAVLDRCPATEQAATCRSYRRATAC